jgi:hypothetical protein
LTLQKRTLDLLCLAGLDTYGKGAFVVLQPLLARQPPLWSHITAAGANAGSIHCCLNADPADATAAAAAVEVVAAVTPQVTGAATAKAQFDAAWLQVHIPAAAAAAAL